MGRCPSGSAAFDREFAWALITLDGAHTPMLHAVFVDGPDQIQTGMRVQIL